MIFAREYEAFQEQLSDLPSCFAGSDGRLLLSKYGDKAARYVALMKLSDSICEMKRLYVRSNFRGLGIGRALAEMVIG